MIKKYWKLWLITAVLAVAGVAVFHFLGGFASPEFEVYNRPAGVLYGHHYEGALKKPEFGLLFNKADARKAASGGVLCAHYFNDPDLNGDTARAAVGLYFGNGEAWPSRVSSGDTIVSIPAGKVLKVSINASYLVAGKLYEKSKEYAGRHNISISMEGVTEFYPAENGVVIEFPVVE